VNDLLLKCDGWKTVPPSGSRRTPAEEQPPAGHSVTEVDAGRACQDLTAAHRHQPAVVERVASALAMATGDWKSPHPASPVQDAVRAPHQADPAEAAAAEVAAWAAAVEVRHPALPAVAPSVAAVAAAEAYVSTRHAADKTADARNTVPSNPQH
jgi:hypothetical protein